MRWEGDRPNLVSAVSRVMEMTHLSRTNADKVILIFTDVSPPIQAQHTFNEVHHVLFYMTESLL